MRLDYEIRLAGGQTLRGSRELEPGANIVKVSLPEGKLESVSGVVELPIARDEKIFMNGYQTWTFCPEYTAEDRVLPWKPLPRFLVKKFGLDRYGDYHFMDYPKKRGLTHGFSYCYFRRGEAYRLFASLDERPGYTIFRYDSKAGKLSIERDCKGLLCGGEFPAFQLYCAQGTEQQVFDGWFDALGIKPRTMEKLTGYSSWYNRYENIDEASVLSDLAGCAQVLRPGDLFQIDDGWQQGVGDWDCNDKFPRGLKPLVDEIHGKGLKAGLWLAPFGCQKGARLMREHPDWLLQVEGQPWYCGCNWGGFYALDIDKPEVRDYLRRVFDRVLNQWGFDLVKLDFLYAAAPFGNERESRAGRMLRAMELLRECCGEKLILGCGVPLMPAFGLVDYCRVSCDVSLDWDDKPYMRLIHRERVSTRQAILTSLFRRQLNGRAFLSDPDVFFLREDNVKLTSAQKKLLADCCSLFGGMLLCSDDMAQYRPEALAQYRQMLKNRQAENVRVLADQGIRVRYTLEGQEKELVIE